MSISATGHFDEPLYLEKNPDVRQALDAGDIASAFHHYITSGHREDRQGMPSDVRFAAEQYLGHPAPAAPLRLRVHGDEDLLNFIRNGQVLAADTLKTFPPDIELSSESRILDFGCGCGRVMPFVRRLLPGLLFGTDIDQEAIDWSAANMNGLATFSTNGAWPPANYPDSFFDLIYSISVFTHLPEDMQTAWLEELARVMKSGARAILTVHGEWLFPREYLPKREVEKFDQSGFYYHMGEKTEGLPEFYRTTFHSDRYVRAHWSKFFDIERIIPRSLNNHHDIVVCRKRL